MARDRLPTSMEAIMYAETRLMLQMLFLTCHMPWLIFISIMISINQLYFFVFIISHMLIVGYPSCLFLIGCLKLIENTVDKTGGNKTHILTKLVAGPKV